MKRKEKFIFLFEEWNEWNGLICAACSIEELHSSNYAVIGYRFPAQHPSIPFSFIPLLLSFFLSTLFTLSFSSIKLNAQGSWSGKDWLNLWSGMGPRERSLRLITNHKNNLTSLLQSNQSFTACDWLMDEERRVVDEEKERKIDWNSKIKVNFYFLL